MRSVSLEFLNLQEAALVGFFAESQLATFFEDDNVGGAGTGDDAHGLSCLNVLKLEKCEFVRVLGWHGVRQQVELEAGGLRRRASKLEDVGGRRGD